MLADRLADDAKNGMYDDAITINPVDLRRVHPRVEEFRSINPYGGSGPTQHDAGQWADEFPSLT